MTRALSKLWTTGAGTNSCSVRWAEKVSSSLRTFLRVAAGAGMQRQRGKLPKRELTERKTGSNRICRRSNCDGTNNGLFFSLNFRVFIKLGSRWTRRCCFPAAHHQEVQANGAAAAISQVNTSLPARLEAGRGPYLPRSQFASVKNSSCSPDQSQLDARVSGPLVSAGAAGSFPALQTGRELATNR